MRYAKLVNGYPHYNPNPIYIDHYWVGNPTGEMLMGEGYLPVTYANPPGDAPSGYQWSETWSETDTEIVQGWELVEVPISEEDALVRYANELTGKQDETLTEATETLIKQLKEDK